VDELNAEEWERWNREGLPPLPPGPLPPRFAASITVLHPGADVLISGEIPARVAAVSIRGEGGISYQVVWWDGRNRFEEWVNSFEVQAVPGGQFPPIRVGFANGVPVGAGRGSVP
jgi:hypothetical protein